ncbi:MAG: hypothetical protein Q7I93_05120 [Syntrophales bacterium]|nr:hypothetical protein [Syntrophales bacterium]
MWRKKTIINEERRLWHKAFYHTSTNWPLPLTHPSVTFYYEATGLSLDMQHIRRRNSPLAGDAFVDQRLAVGEEGFDLLLYHG